MVERMTPFIRVLLLIALYPFIGWLSLKLAIPPGYATAVFLSSGVALGAVLLWGNGMLPGVFLGSFILNTIVGFEAQGELTTVATLVAVLISSGATLQTALGAYLIRRCIGFPVPLTDERQIFLFLTFGGPLSCLVSPSIGVTALFFSNTIPSSQYLFSWWTWWVGDTIGVLIAGTLMLIFFAKPRLLWRKRITTVALPLVASCTVVVILFVQASTWEQQRIQLKFREQSTLLAEAIKFRFTVYLNELQALEQFYISSEYVDRQEFKSFVSTTLKNYPGIQALEWLPAISDQQRDTFEAMTKDEGYPYFTITEHDDNEKLIRARQRNEYFPVAFVEPFAGNEKAFGYDVASNPVRRFALDNARDSATTIMTARVTLVQDSTQQGGVLIFHPVYGRGVKPIPVNERRDRLRGFMLGVIRLSDLFEAAASAFSKANYFIQVIDVTDPAVSSQLYGSVPNEITPAQLELHWEHLFNIGGRRLKLIYYPSEYFLQNNHGLESWYALAGGLLLCSLLGSFLLSVSGQANKIQELVDQRTLELRAILDNAVESIIIFNEYGSIDSVNPAATTLFGFSQEELLSTKVQQILPELRHSVDDNTFHFDNAISSQMKSGKFMETSGIRKGGQSIALELGVSEVILPTKRLFTCMIHDVSERKKVDRMKSEFISTVSHELRTPATSILGSLALLEGGVIGSLSDEKASGLIKIAKNNSERLVSLINDILDIEKLELDRLEFHMKPEKVMPLLVDAVNQNKGYADAYDVELQLDENSIDNQKVSVNIDAYRFSQVMANLLSNAVKFSNKDGKVVIDFQFNAKEVKVLVIDHGRGISNEFKDRIFQKFAQEDGTDTRSHGGTGLGLSIAKMIVEKMGGKVGFNSKTGEGTTFYFTLPIILG
jgi:PAS domain S-box-containing protein